MAYTSPSLTASGTTWALLQAGGITAHLEKLIAAQAATLAPTVTGTFADTASSGGSLAAGTYYAVVTETNGIGESTIGPESAQLTVTATHINTYTFQALKAGNTARNLYLGAVGGGSGGPYTLYADGVTAATFACSAAVLANSKAVAPPATNTTGFSTKTLSLLRAAKRGNLQDVYVFLADVVTNFTSGQNVDFGIEIKKLHDAHVAFLALATICAEIGVLLDANPGTLGSVATGIGNRQVTRTWP